MYIVELVEKKLGANFFEGEDGRRRGRRLL